MVVFSTVALIGVLALVATDIFIWTPEAQEQTQNVLSFCQEKGFTDFQYIRNFYVSTQEGFCYKEFNGQVQKQSFFIDKQKRILIMNE